MNHVDTSIPAKPISLFSGEFCGLVIDEGFDQEADSCNNTKLYVCECHWVIELIQDYLPDIIGN